MQKGGTDNHNMYFEGRTNNLDIYFGGGKDNLNIYFRGLGRTTFLFYQLLLLSLNKIKT